MGAAAVGHAAAPFSRELSTDRPDTTESPYTVEAGRWQIEAEPARWSRDSAEGVRVETLSLAAANIKYGLSPDADLQVIIEPHVRVRTIDGATRNTIDGIGDTIVRLKMNISGNDGGPTAIAVMPFVKLPTASHGLGNDKVEGGFIVPFAGEIGGGWRYGLMAELDLVRNDANDGYAFSVLTTATVAGEIAPGVGVFFEIANEARNRHTSRWATSFNAGVTYALGENTQLDLGANFALTDDAEDRAYFLGVSTRW